MSLLFLYHLLFLYLILVLLLPRLSRSLPRCLSLLFRFWLRASNDPPLHLYIRSSSFSVHFLLPFCSSSYASFSPSIYISFSCSFILLIVVYLSLLMVLILLLLFLSLLTLRQGLTLNLHDLFLTGELIMPYPIFPFRLLLLLPLHRRFEIVEGTFLTQIVNQTSRENNILDLTTVTDPDHLRNCEVSGCDHHMIRIIIRTEHNLTNHMSTVSDYRKAKFNSERELGPPSV